MGCSFVKWNWRCPQITASVRGPKREGHLSQDQDGQSAVSSHHDEGLLVRDFKLEIISFVLRQQILSESLCRRRKTSLPDCLQRDSADWTPMIRMIVGMTVSASFSQFQPVMSHESEVVPCSCKESERTNDVGRSVGSSLDCSELHRKRSCIKTPHDKFFDAFAK